MLIHSAAAREYRAGRLAEACQVLEREGVRSAEDGVLFAELLYLRGHASRAAGEAETRLSNPSLPLALKSRCLSLVSACQADQGTLEAALVSGRRAMTYAEEAGEPALAALTAALLLERSFDRTGFDASLPMAAQVRRRAARWY